MTYEEGRGEESAHSLVVTLDFRAGAGGRGEGKRRHVIVVEGLCIECKD